MRLHASPTSTELAREVGPERGADLLEVGTAPGDRDDWEAGRPVQTIQVDDVESADGDPVEEEHARVRDVPVCFEEPDDPVGGVVPVDADSSDGDRLEVLGGGDDDRGDRRVPLSAVERPVVDSDDPHVGLLERPTQR